MIAMLTSRAANYLAGLERLERVSTREVETTLLGQGFPCFAPWLEFHERYAGYVEPMGRDVAIWGIVHRRSEWLDSGRADVDREIKMDIWYAVCADVHPAYNYRLNNDGEFFGRMATSFDVKIERNALVASFSAKGPNRYITSELHDAAFAQRLRAELGPRLDAAASDSTFVTMRTTSTS